MADTYTFNSLLNTTDGMTAVINNKKQDDNTVSVGGVDWFTYAGKTVSTVYVNGNNWIGFGQSAAQLYICNRDGAVYYIYRQEGVLDTGKKFLKIRVEGYTYYSSTSAAYAVKYEIFLIEGQTLFVNVIQIPTNSSYIGTSSVSSGSGTEKFNITTAAEMPLYILIENAGADQKVTYELYPPKTYTSIAVTTPPNKTSYYEGQAFDKTGMVVTGTTSDGETVAINGYLISGFDSSKTGTNTVTVSFKNCTTTFDVQILEDVPVEITGISVETNHILLNDELPIVLSINVKYASEKTQWISSGFEVLDFDNTTSGTKNLTISYSGLTSQKDIYVSNTATVDLTSETKMTYLIGETLDNACCVVVYDDGYQRILSYSQVTITGFDSSAAGVCKLKVTYRNITNTVSVTITDTLTANIGYETDTDIIASLNITTGTLTLSGTGETKYINSPSWGTGGIFNDGGMYSEKVKKIIVSAGITNLNAACFYEMTNVTEALLPETLKILGAECFYGCRSLEKISLPNAIKAIGQSCFFGCTSLKELTIPESVNLIGNNAFDNGQTMNLVVTILNRNVSIKDSNSYASTLNVKKIIGYVASTAEEYAEKYNIEFEALNTVASISVKKEPNKKEYWPLGAIDATGLILEITDENGISVDVTNEFIGVTIETPDMETTGEKDVIVKYKEHTDTYKIVVTAPAFEDIFGNTNKMSIGRNTMSIPWFMFDGEECKNIVCYTDGSIGFSGTEKIDIMRNRLYNSGDTYSAAATKISALETILNNGIRVAKFRCEGTFSGNYRKGSFPFEIYFFSTGDIYISITGYTQAVTKNWKGTLTSGGTTYSIYGANNTAANENVSVQTSCYHKDGTGLVWQIKSEEYSFPDVPQKAEILKLPDKIDYFVDENIDTTGMEVVLVYSDGRKEISEKYTVNVPDTTTIGIKQVTVTDTETGITSEPFDIYVNLIKNIGSPNEGDVQGITDIRGGTLTISGSGETGDFEILSPPFIKAMKYLNLIKVGPGITTLGVAILAGTVTEKEITGLETVQRFNEFALYSAKISGKINLENARIIEKSVFLGTSLEKVSIGNKIREIGQNAFSSETITEIKINRIKDSVSGSPWGAENATVTWKGTMTSLKITPPDKTAYILGEEFDTTGMIVTAVCDNGETENITDYEISGYDKSTLGSQLITVSYMNMSIAFNVTVYGETTGIRISRYPEKIYYKVGETLDTTGLKVMVIDSQGTERETTKYKVSKLDTKTAGTKTVRISYQDAGTEITWSYDFQVYVTKDASNPFTKTKASVSITVHWPNGEFKDLTNGDIVKKSMKLKESICNERYFIWGGCISNCLTFRTGSEQFWGTEENDVPHGKIEVFIECDGTKEQIFTGIIDSGKRDKGLLTRTIVAYDGLYQYRNTDIAWWYKNRTADMQMILTQKQFRVLLFDYLGIEQEETSLKYDNASVPNNNLSSEMDPVDILQDLCLQNSVFGWMDREGVFRYLDIKPNARQAGTTTDGKKIFEYFEPAVHYDIFDSKEVEITEGRLWYPNEFLADPYPGIFSPGDIPAQEAYEQNIFYNRNSFFVGNQDWIDSAFQADEYGMFTKEKPIMNICYGTTTKWDPGHMYIAQGYKVRVKGNPLTRIGSKIQLLIRKRTPPVEGYPEGKVLEWKINSYIMSRTMEITGEGIMETYSAENGPYNSNKSQLGKHTQELTALAANTRSKLPTISYAKFTSGSSADENKTKKSDFRCIKKMEQSEYEALFNSGETRRDTLYCTWEED